MLQLRIVGGPVGRTDKVLIDVTPLTTFESMFPLIQAELFRTGIVMSSNSVTSEQFDLMGLEFVEGGKARPTSVLFLGDTPRGVGLLAPALFLKPKSISSSSFDKNELDSSPALRRSLSVARSVSPNSKEHAGGALRSAAEHIRRSVSATGSEEGSFLSTPSAPVMPLSSWAHHTAAGRSSVKEQLIAFYGAVTPQEYLLVERVLRRCQKRDKVETMVALTERAAAELSQVVSGRRSSLAAVVGSPSQLLRRMRSSGVLNGLNSTSESSRKQSIGDLVSSLTRPTGGSELLARQSSLSADRALSIIADPAASLTTSTSLTVSILETEGRTAPLFAVSALLHKLLCLKYERRNFEKLEQEERFRGEAVELVRYESVRRLVTAQMFYAVWCAMQQAYFAVGERWVRAKVAGLQVVELNKVLLRGFVSLEEACRSQNIIMVERRYRFHIYSYLTQSLEHTRRAEVLGAYWARMRLLELQRDFHKAEKVMSQVYRYAWHGYQQLELLKMMHLEFTYRRMFCEREARLRRLLFEMCEALHRQWLEESILAWLEPVVEKIASKAIADGRILLALEMKEMRNTRAREEARLRVLIRSHSIVKF